MQEGKQPLRARLQLLARLTLNAGEDAANQPARLAQLDDGNDRAILVQGNQGPAQIVRLGHRGTPSIDVSDEIAILAARPIASHRWREVDSNLYGAFSVKSRFWFVGGSLFEAGKPFFVPSPNDQVRGARRRGQGTETLAELAACRLAGLVFRSALTPEH